MSSTAANTRFALANGGASIGPVPYALTPLIGRDHLIESAAARLAAPYTRLLTLVGPGGIGKTRLALEIAHAVSDRFPDGVLLIRLASVTDPSLVRTSLASALGVRNPDDRTFSWSIARNREILLVLDNFEQVLPAAPDIVEVLSHCPLVKILITSRAPLHVTGENEFLVPPLAIPGDEESDPETLLANDAVQLFADRATAANARFQLTARNTGAVAAIVRQLDGIPLALELAAAQCKHLSPEAIAERLPAPEELLAGGPIDRPPHQRAMHDTIAWSYDLLDPIEQRRFRHLSVFAGGFLTQAAEYICDCDNPLPHITGPDERRPADGDILQTCIALSDKSLIFKSTDYNCEPRFSMLRTIRGFAHAELKAHGECDVVASRHATWYLALAETAATHLNGPHQRAWLDWLDLETANLRAALEWLRANGDYQACGRLVNALSEYWLLHGHFAEGIRWITQVTEQPQVRSIDPFLATDLHSAGGWLALRLGRIAEARAFAERALAIARERDETIQVAEALNLLGYLEDRATDYQTAERLLRESLAAYRKAEYRIGIVDTLVSLAGIELNLGNVEQAHRHFQEAIDSTSKTGEALTHARALDHLGNLLLVQGNATEAAPLLEEALALYQARGSVRGTAIALDHLGKCRRALGDIEQAWDRHRQSLPMRRDLGDPRGMCVWLEAVASLLVASGADEAATRILGATCAIREQGCFPLHGHERIEHEAALRTIRHRLEPGIFATQWAIGAARSLADTVDAAWDDANAAVHVVVERVNRDLSVFMHTHALTARELDVLQCLARRLTDKEIAAELQISPRTVSTHVAVILGKLNVRSRRDAARLTEHV
jgi:predicted ATPase/DNA-binding CsgD family transcriptional regulator